MSSAPERSYNVPNLVRALRILELLSGESEGRTLSQLAAATGFPMNAVYRITQTLIFHGYLRRDLKTKRISLTRKLMSLSCAAHGDHDLIQESRDVVVELRNALGETVCLGMLAGDEGTVVDQVLGVHPFKFMIDIGSRFPLHSTAPGKAILAFLPESERELILKRIKLPPLTPHTIRTKTRLRAELKTTAQAGYATDRCESADGCHCVSAPILNELGIPVLAIWITGPADRLRSEDFKKVGLLLMAHAEKIRRKLGWL